MTEVEDQAPKKERWEVRLFKTGIAAAIPVLTVILTVKPDDLKSNFDVYRGPLLWGILALLVIVGLVSLTNAWTARSALIVTLQEELHEAEEAAHDLELDNAKLGSTSPRRLQPAIHVFSAKRYRTDIVEDAFRQARQTIDVTGVANEMVTSDLDEGFFESFFRGGGLLRVLFIDPASQAVRDRESQEAWPPGHLATKTTANIARLRQYVSLLVPDGVGRLEIRVYDHSPTLNLVLIDNQWLLAHHYGWAAHGTNTPTVEIDNRVASRPEEESLDDLELRTNLVRYYQKEFETLWNLGTVVPLQ